MKQIADTDKVIDISQEVFGCEVYPGDRAPMAIPEKRMADGEVYNLSAFSMCAHNGTHLDAPFHFFREGKTVEQIPLCKTVGLCAVIAFEGQLTADGAEAVLEHAHGLDPAVKKILLKGSGEITEDAARVFARAGLHLLGVESQSVGPIHAPMAVHRILLGAEVCLLEGLRLKEAEDGLYLLHAAPLSLAGFDGAPCRATLIPL